MLKSHYTYYTLSLRSLVSRYSLESSSQMTRDSTLRSLNSLWDMPSRSCVILTHSCTQLLSSKNFFFYAAVVSYKKRCSRVETNNSHERRRDKIPTIQSLEVSISKNITYFVFFSQIFQRSLITSASSIFPFKTTRIFLKKTQSKKRYIKKNQLVDFTQFVMISISVKSFHFFLFVALAVSRNVLCAFEINRWNTHFESNPMSSYGKYARFARETHVKSSLRLICLIKKKNCKR